MHVWYVNDKEQKLLIDKEKNLTAFSLSFSPQGVLAVSDANKILIYKDIKTGE